MYYCTLEVIWYAVVWIPMLIYLCLVALTLRRFCNNRLTNGVFIVSLVIRCIWLVTKFASCEPNIYLPILKIMSMIEQ